MARKSKSHHSKSRTSKSRPSEMGRKWTQDDVLTYNIKVVYQDLQTFFGVTDLPSPNNESNDISAQDFATSKEPWTSSMLRYMNRVADPENRVPATIDFVRELFKVVRYENLAQRRCAMMRPPLHYLVSRGRPPQVDICIMDFNVDNDHFAIQLVVKVDRHSRGFDPEPRLISDAIAAFHNDNIIRIKHLGIDPLTSKVMPGIVMNGTMPTFYKIPITPELVRAVESGERPEEETLVHAYIPEVPRPEEGMKQLDNRYIILSCFEAFRQFM